MERLIELIEEAIKHDPQLFWIVRKRSPSMQEGPGLYFAHIYNVASVSAKGYADTPKEALQRALDCFVIEASNA